MSFQITPHVLAKIRKISESAQTAEAFFDRFVRSMGGIKLDTARNLNGAPVGGADYLFQNELIAELKVLEKDGWDDYNRKMDSLFSKYRASGDLKALTNQEETNLDDPAIPEAMRNEWYSILLKPMRSRFREADRQLGLSQKSMPVAKGVLILLNSQNRLHAEPARVYWLIRDNVLSGGNFPNVRAWHYLSLPVPELMNAGVNRSMFSWYFPRPEDEMPDGSWRDEGLRLKLRGLDEQWHRFLEREFGIVIRRMDPSEILSPSS